MDLDCTVNVNGKHRASRACQLHIRTGW